MNGDYRLHLRPRESCVRKSWQRLWPVAWYERWHRRSRHNGHQDLLVPWLWHPIHWWGLKAGSDTFWTPGPAFWWHPAPGQMSWACLLGQTSGWEWNCVLCLISFRHDEATTEKPVRDLRENWWVIVVQLISGLNDYHDVVFSQLLRMGNNHSL